MVAGFLSASRGPALAFAGRLHPLPLLGLGLPPPTSQLSNKMKVI